MELVDIFSVDRGIEADQHLRHQYSRCHDHHEEKFKLMLARPYLLDVFECSVLMLPMHVLDLRDVSTVSLCTLLCDPQSFLLALLNLLSL